MTPVIVAAEAGSGGPAAGVRQNWRAAISVYLHHGIISIPSQLALCGGVSVLCSVRLLLLSVAAPFIQPSQTHPGIYRQAEHRVCTHRL